MEKIVSVSEAARIVKVTRQALYLAIRENKLKACEYRNTLKVRMSDLEDYIEKKWSREHHSMKDGKKVFDKDKGFLSVDTAAKMLNMDRQQVYYALRKGEIKYIRKQGHYIIKASELFRFNQLRMKVLEERLKNQGFNLHSA